ncbi:MAG: hypothetical protein Q9227_006152 [Pyrenula ochraceoflavens]
MVGSLQTGNIGDPDNEGHDGAIIDEILTFSDASLGQNPNVVLLMAGTNDLATNNNVDEAPGRLTNLINHVHSKVPKAAIIVAKLTPSGPPNSADMNQRITDYNGQIEGAVANSDAKNSVIVDMQSGEVTNMPSGVTASTNPGLTANDLTPGDGLHPSDEGYNKMAQIWLAGMNAAKQGGLIDGVDASYSKRRSLGFSA